MAHVATYKKETVTEFVELAKKFKIIGVVNMEGLPTPQVQVMRASLRKEGVALHMTKKRLLKIVLKDLEKVKPNISHMVDNLRGMPAILFAQENPFKLYKKLQASKSSAPAKAGQIAPRDIVVPAGPTPFAPGPIIGELGQFKIKTGIENGKVAVKADTVVAKEGDKISAGLASILTRLGIMPMEIGLDLVAAYENGTIFNKSVMAVDEKEYIDNIGLAHNYAFNLAVEVAFMTSQTTETLLSKAFADAKALAVEQAILAKECVDQILARAHAQATSVQQIVNG